MDTSKSVDLALPVLILAEGYGLHEESFSIWSSCRFSVTIDGEKMTNLGRVSNASLHDL